MLHDIHFFLSIDEQNLFLHQGIPAIREWLLGMPQEDIHFLLNSIDGHILDWLLENEVLNLQQLGNNNPYAS